VVSMRVRGDGRGSGVGPEPPPHPRKHVPKTNARSPARRACAARYQPAGAPPPPSLSPGPSCPGTTRRARPPARPQTPPRSPPRTLPCPRTTCRPCWGSPRCRTGSGAARRRGCGRCGPAGVAWPPGRGRFRPRSGRGLPRPRPRRGRATAAIPSSPGSAPAHHIISYHAHDGVKRCVRRGRQGGTDGKRACRRARGWRATGPVCEKGSAP